MLVTSRRVLAGGELAPATIRIEGESIAAVRHGEASGAWNLGELLILPGMVDLHGDAFERQWMPRPGVFFPVKVALHETDRQMIANGITTSYHGLTVSWEPGLRGVEHGRVLVEALEEESASLQCDTKIHLRYEVFALEEAEELIGWIESGRVHMIGFNDHSQMIVEQLRNETKAGKYAERTGLTVAGYRELLAAALERSHEVPAALERVAAAGRVRAIPLASHDDETPEMRESYSALGATICEFPVDAITACAAREAGSDVVMGSPNIVRGGSHARRMTAMDGVRDGYCNVLASDYYYPSMLHSVFRAASETGMPLAAAWNLVSENPARAAGLADRGTLEEGLRADFVAVDDRDPAHPRIAITVAAGKVVYCAEPSLIGDLHELAVR